MAQTYKSKDRGDKAVLETVFTDRGMGVYGFQQIRKQPLTGSGLLKPADAAAAARMVPMRLNMLREASGIVHIFRPSPDVLVVLPIAGTPKYYALPVTPPLTPPNHRAAIRHR